MLKIASFNDNKGLKLETRPLMLHQEGSWAEPDIGMTDPIEYFDTNVNNNNDIILMNEYLVGDPLGKTF